MDWLVVPMSKGTPPPSDLVLPDDVLALIWHHVLRFSGAICDRPMPPGVLHAQVALRRLGRAWDASFVEAGGWMCCARALHAEYVAKKRRLVELEATRCRAYPLSPCHPRGCVVSVVSE